MKLTKDRKIEILDKSLLVILEGHCICWSVQRVCIELSIFFNDVEEILPEFGAMKPFYKETYSYWFGSDFKLDKNIEVRYKKVIKLINLYQRDIWIEMWLWRQIAKVKRIFKK